MSLTMLLIGGFPWAYTPLLFGSDNKQTWGMLETMIFLVLEREIWCQFIILARKDEPTPDYARKDEPTPDYATPDYAKR
jgi:hypothetical protein